MQEDYLKCIKWSNLQFSWFWTSESEVQTSKVEILNFSRFELDLKSFSPWQVNYRNWLLQEGVIFKDHVSNSVWVWRSYLFFALVESVILIIDDKWYCFNRVTFKVLETTYRKLYLYRNNGTGCNFYLNR